MKLLLRRWLYLLASRTASARIEHPKRRFSLGILKLDRLGDAVLTFGAVRRLLMEFDEADTLLVVSPLAEPLFRAEFPKATLLVLPAFAHNAAEYLAVLCRHGSSIRGFGAERLVCLRHQPSDYLHTIAQCLAPGVTFAAAADRSWSRTDLSYPHPEWVDYPADGPCRELEAHRRIVERAIGKPVALEEVMPGFHSISPVDGDSLLVCPEAGDRLRVYPSGQLAEALRLFASNCSVPIEVCLPPSASEKAWRSAFRDIGIRAWHRPIDALALARMIAGAGGVLASESAPAHVAAAFDKRGVFLLGGGHFGILAPWRKSARQQWIFQRMDCYGCNWNCPYPQPRCITELAPEQIAQTLCEVYSHEAH